MKFKWDRKKAESNLRKHGVHFKSATAIFADENRLTVTDDRKDYKEERYTTLGMIEDRLYVVIYTTASETIRIISARKANKREQKRYGNH